MGRGLEAILSVSAEGADARAEELRELPVELISPNPKQPRRRFDERALLALAASLGERGMLQPVLVRPLPGGPMSWSPASAAGGPRAIAGLSSVPALVRSREDGEALELALIENMAREDLSPIEEARACAALVEELGLTREEVGRRVGRGRVAVSNLIRLLDLPDEVIELLQEGALSEGHGRALLLAEDHGARRASCAQPRSRRDGRCEPSKRARARATARRCREPARAGAGRITTHPDQEQAASEIAETLGSALGAEVQRAAHAPTGAIAPSCASTAPRRRSSLRAGCGCARWPSGLDVLTPRRRRAPARRAGR